MSSTIDRYLEARVAGNPHAGERITEKGVDRVRRALNQFERWIECDLTSINESDAKIILDKIETYQDKIHRQWMRAIARGFLEWATSEGLYDRPNYFWFAGRTDDFGMNDDIVAMPLAHIKELMRKAAELPDEDRALTYQLMLGLVGFGGLRFSEVGQIKREDIFDDGVMIRRDNRFVPLSADLIAMLRQAAETSSSEWVVNSWDKNSDKSKPLAEYFVSRQLGRFMQQVDPDETQFVPFSVRKGFLEKLKEVTQDDESAYFAIAGHSHLLAQPLRPVIDKTDLIKTYEEVISK